jgi:hypothetical protein
MNTGKLQLWESIKNEKNKKKIKIVHFSLWYTQNNTHKTCFKVTSFYQKSFSG